MAAMTCSGRMRLDRWGIMPTENVRWEKAASLEDSWSAQSQVRFLSVGRKAARWRLAIGG